MKRIMPTWAMPLNIFQVYGTMCCVNMTMLFQNNIFAENFLCYDARSIHDANFVILWGSFSLKLRTLVTEELEKTARTQAILHMRGCNNRVDNNYSQSTLAEFPACLAFSHCLLNDDDMKILLREARACLKM